MSMLPPAFVGTSSDLPVAYGRDPEVGVWEVVAEQTEPGYVRRPGPALGRDLQDAHNELGIGFESFDRHGSGARIDGGEVQATDRRSVVLAPDLATGSVSQFQHDLVSRPDRRGWVQAVVPGKMSKFR
jgi:hypothetical protein